MPSHLHTACRLPLLPSVPLDVCAQDPPPEAYDASDPLVADMPSYGAPPRPHVHPPKSWNRHVYLAAEKGTGVGSPRCCSRPAVGLFMLGFDFHLTAEGPCSYLARLCCLEDGAPIILFTLQALV